jgi:hypothetical protein
MHITGHAGCFKTLEIVSRNYWWSQDIVLYVKNAIEQSYNTVNPLGNSIPLRL